MTDTERTTLEQQISEGLLRLGYFRVWRPADACPQGHSNQDPETDAPLADVGELCGECVIEWQDRQVADPSAIRALAMDLMARGQCDGPPDTVRDDPMAMANYIVTKAVLCHDQDPTWHPEWRIGKAPKRWTQDLAALLRALKWAKGEQVIATWTVESPWPEVLTIRAEVRYRRPREPWLSVAVGEDETPPEALAWAMARWLENVAQGGTA